MFDLWKIIRLVGKVTPHWDIRLCKCLLHQDLLSSAFISNVYDVFNGEWCLNNVFKRAHQDFSVYQQPIARHPNIIKLEKGFFEGLADF